MIHEEANEKFEEEKPSHNNNVKKNVKVNCPVCGDEMKDTYSLFSVQKHMHEDYTFKCPYCDFNCWKWIDMKLHIWGHPEDVG